jgi:hypothetical protein
MDRHVDARGDKFDLNARTELKVENAVAIRVKARVNILRDEPLGENHQEPSSAYEDGGKAGHEDRTRYGEAV